MSHLCTIDSVIVDLDALRCACDALGYRLIEGGKVRYYYGEGEECHYVIEFPDDHKCRKYNIGLQWRDDKQAYEIRMDNAMNGPVTPEGQYGGDTEEIKGELEQQYNYAVVMAEMDVSWEVREHTDEKGNITVIAKTQEGGY